MSNELDCQNRAVNKDTNVTVFWIPTDPNTNCMPPPTYTHTQTGECKKEGGRTTQTNTKPWTLFVLANGHKETAWPQHFKLSIWGSLMCIDSYCTKGTKTIIGCFVCLNSSPKIPWYVQWSNLCLQSVWLDSVCVKSTLTKRYCVSRKST